jgi:hypothetical protein
MAGELTKAVNKGILDLLDPRNQGINQDMAGFARSQAPMQEMPMASRPSPVAAQGAVTSPLGNNPSLNPSEAMMQPVSRPQQPSGDPEYGRYLQSLVSEQQPQRGILRDSEGRPVTSGSGEAVRTGDSELPMVKQFVSQEAQKAMQELDPEKVKDKDPAEVQNAAVGYAVAKNADKLSQVRNEQGLQDTLKKAFGNEEMWLTLAMGFNSMRMRPDAGLAGVIGKRLETIRANKQQNQTISKLAASGDPIYKKTAELMSQGMSFKDAYKAAQGGEEPAAIQTLRIRAKEAGLKEGTPEYQKFMAEGGVKKGMGVRVRPDGTVEFVQGGDLPSLTEAQSNALIFSQRMRQSNDILEQYEQQGTNIGQALASGIPLVGNYMLSDEYQRYDQARRNFVNAVLRKESGAAIAESEFRNAEKQYFPIPGDSQAVIEQKRKNRELAMKLMEQTVPGAEKFAEKTQQAEAPKTSMPPVGAKVRTLDELRKAAK